LPPGRICFNVVVFSQFEKGVWSGCGGCLRYRSVGLSKAVSFVVPVVDGWFWEDKDMPK
jgi:hypothetical protein